MPLKAYIFTRCDLTSKIGTKESVIKVKPDTLLHVFEFRWIIDWYAKLRLEKMLLSMRQMWVQIKINQAIQM